MKNVALYFLISLFSIAANAETEYVIGRAPQLSAVAVSQVWTPFIEYLNEHTGYKFKLKVYQERREFEQDVINGSLDFYYGNPGYLVVGKKLHGYDGLVRSNKKQLKGIIVARADSGITHISQLENKDIVFPGKNAFAASLYIRSLLSQELKLPFQEKYVTGHDNVYRAVALGRYPAGGGVVRTFDREPATLKSKLKIIYETPGMAPHPVAVHPRVPSAVKKALADTVLEMPNSPEGNALLTKVKIQKPVKVDYKRDYLPVEAIALNMYADLVK
ncbi:MAG: phosphate/phosphite/phosphonate ABC transporter substrate-binding protein [Gammaproteobacteria bacterium]|nr:phosphate/phosphite/phosphonate ABC transporter substrate-binding protein [Gammaproteobacteria bacterium]